MPYVAGVKITKSQMREVFPDSVRIKVFELMTTRRTRNVRLFNEPKGWELYLDEGSHYTFYYGNEERQVTMQAQHSLHAGGHPTGHRVGQRMALPVGTWVVEYKLFLGKPFINVYNVGLAGLEESNV